jgi:hypothetical protein
MLDLKQTCWRCCDRLCRRCGQQTGSALVDICWSCWFQVRGGARENQRLLWDYAAN